MQKASQILRFRLSVLLLLVSLLAVAIYFVPNLWHAIQYRHVDDSVLEDYNVNIADDGTFMIYGSSTNVLSEPAKLTDALNKYRAQTVFFSGITDYSQLGELHYLKNVYFYRYEIDLDQCVFLKDVEKLGFEQCVVHHTKQTPFENTERLVVKQSSIDGGTEQFFHRFPNLTEVELSLKPEEGQEMMLKILENIKVITHLGIEYETMDVKALNRLPAMPRLEYLGLTYCDIGREEVQWISEHFKTLKVLRLNEISFSRIELESILNQMPFMEALHLEATYIPPDERKRIREKFPYVKIYPEYPDN